MLVIEENLTLHGLGSAYSAQPQQEVAESEISTWRTRRKQGAELQTSN